MKTFAKLTVGILLLSTAMFSQSFSTKDKLLILVTGNVASTSMFGFSGQASLYQATGTNADGSIQFSPVSGAQNVPVERNSAADFTNVSNYGTKGFIPPGIYFLHYHRLDLSIAPIRHRLGLSDNPGEETIVVNVGNAQVTRIALQFHIAFNDLQSFNTHVSEGCITLTAANFTKLFPNALFDSSQSPLAPGNTDPNNLKLQGAKSNVLVFVTDVITPNVQNKQITLFRSGLGLKPADFGVGVTSQLSALRVLWKSGTNAAVHPKSLNARKHVIASTRRNADNKGSR